MGVLSTCLVRPPYIYFTFPHPSSELRDFFFSQSVRSIIKLCRYSPHALVMVGSTLQGQGRLFSWEAARESLARCFNFSRVMSAKAICSFALDCYTSFFVRLVGLIFLLRVFYLMIMMESQ